MRGIVGDRLLEHLCRHADLPDWTARGSLHGETRHEPDTRVVYLPCPVCKALMMRRTIATGTGVIVDTCHSHGLWLDHGELERILAFVRARGIDELAVLRPPKPTIAERADLEQARRRLLLADRRNSTSEILFDILVQLAEMLMIRR
jgi:Zn-finger nucleic acid-binding protein